MNKKKYKKKMTLNHKQYKKMLDDICSENCSEDNDCVLKSFLLSAHHSPKLLMQMKCAHKFKEVLAEEQGRKKEDIGTTEAMQEWIERNYAAKFSEVYKEGIPYIKLYKMIMERKE